MAGEKISHGGYELNEEEQMALGKAVNGLVRENLLTGSDLRCSHTILSQPDLGDGRYQYSFNFYGEENQEDLIADQISRAVAANGRGVRDRLKSEFSQLRRVEFEVWDGKVLAVVCMLDEMVDSAEETDDETVERLAGFSAEDLTRRFGMAEAAMEMKGRRLFHALGISGIEFERVDGVRDCKVVCVARCAADVFEAFSAKMRSFGIPATAVSGDPYAKITCAVGSEIFDSGVWPKVAGVTGGVAEAVKGVVSGSSGF